MLKWIVYIIATHSLIIMLFINGKTKYNILVVFTCYSDANIMKSLKNH